MQIMQSYIIRAIYYIEQKILEYYLASQQIQEHKNIQNQDEKEKKLNEVRKKIDQAPERISLADNNLKISDNFIQKKVSGDRNCLYRSILESLGIYQKNKKSTTFSGNCKVRRKSHMAHKLACEFSKRTFRQNRTAQHILRRRSNHIHRLTLQQNNSNLHERQRTNMDKNKI